MKILAIDIGNTNSVFAFINEHDEITAQYRMRSDAARTGDEYFAWLRGLMQYDGHSMSVDAIVLSSTVPKAVFNIRQFAVRYFGLHPFVVGADGVNINVTAHVDAGVRVGPDRLVNTMAAHAQYGGPFTVVDFGTATTFDCGDENGDYIGGAIAPGVNLSLKALTDAAAALPSIDVARPAKVIGTNTVSTMQTGIYWGYIGLIEGIATKIKTEFGDPNMKIIATGGLASLFARGTEIFDIVDKDLTIMGLARIARLNT